MTKPDELKYKFYDDLDSVISAKPRIDKLILLGLVTSMPELVQIARHGNEWFDQRAYANATAMVSYSYDNVAKHDLVTNAVLSQPNMDVPSFQTLASQWLYHMCVGKTERMLEWQRPCVEQTTGQITDVLSANSTYECNLHGDHKTRKLLRILMYPSWNKIARESFYQWYLQPSRYSATQFRGPRRELNSLSKYGALFSSKMHLAEIRTGSVRMMKQSEKRCLYKAHQDDTSSVSKTAVFKNICKTVQSRLRDMQNSWLSSKTGEIQSFADRKDCSMIYWRQFMVHKALATPHFLVRMQAHFWQIKTLSEHFDRLSVLNPSSSYNDNAMKRLQKVECNVRLDEFPTVTETMKTIQQLSSGRAPGSDAIPAERSTSGIETYRVVSLDVEKEHYPTRFQECIHNLPIQTERQSPSLWQP